MAVHLELRHEGSVEETKGKERLAVKLSSFVTLLPFWGETMERHSRPSAHLLSKVLWPLFNLSDGHQTFGKRSGNSSGHGVFERSVVGRWSDQCGIYLRPKQNYHTYIPMFRFLTVVIAYCLRLTMQYERNPLSSLSPITGRVEYKDACPLQKRGIPFHLHQCQQHLQQDSRAEFASDIGWSENWLLLFMAEALLWRNVARRKGPKNASPSHTGHK